MKRIAILLLGAMMLTLISSCGDRNKEDFEIVIDWIWDGMNELYYWTDEIDQSLYPTDMTDPEAFFYSVLYAGDRFSWIVDDAQALKNSFQGKEVSNGISPYFIRVNEDGDVIAVVAYVSPESPADDAGVQRGDIISDVNGTGMNIDNYVELFYSDEVTYDFVNYINGALYKSDRQVSLTSIELNQNPVHHEEVINYEGHKIGYIVYTQFTEGDGDEWLTAFDQAISDLSAASIDALVVDLRYNPGGSVSMATHVAAAIGPSSLAGSDDVFVNFQWNTLMQDYFEQKDGENSPYLVVNFKDATPVVTLNMQQVYFLTGSRTASASELLMTGLDPYMSVTMIGDTTYGKPFGSITVEDIEDPPRHNWAMQPIVFKYANAVGFNDFENGLNPDYPMYDDILNALPFGDINDPMLAKALELITGVSPLMKKDMETIPRRVPLQDEHYERKVQTRLDSGLDPAIILPGLQK